MKNDGKILLQQIKQTTFSRIKPQFEHSKSYVYIRIKQKKLHKNSAMFQSSQNVQDNVLKYNPNRLLRSKNHNRSQKKKNIFQKFHKVPHVLNGSSLYIKKKSIDLIIQSESYKRYIHKTFNSDYNKSSKHKILSRIAKRSTLNEIQNLNSHSQNMINKNFGQSNIPNLTPVTGESTKGSAQVMLNTGSFKRYLFLFRQIISSL